MVIYQNKVFEHIYSFRTWKNSGTMEKNYGTMAKTMVL